ncbi:diguanylate cyclase [Alteromonas sp. ASW11-19]|uniref:Diguanylate cyclase n=1 Tax=Alteromonas salexigens TaxID=2982530 RepID=A0ABT2VKE9_9ALTE|nr:diguanylate cyclase [Alteromonas salexigens]MCU7553752.1 diguanylate cyclase [Alteromonas salexigens]
MSSIEGLDIRKILEHAHVGVVIHRADTSIIYANPAALKLLQLEYQEIIGADAYDPKWHFIDESGCPLNLDDYPVNRVQKTGTNIDNEIMGMVDAGGQDISWFMVNAYMEGRPGADSCFVVVTFSDVTATVKPFSAEDILENAQDVIIVTEADDIDYPNGPRIVYVNKAFEQLTGYSKDEVLGETPRILQGSLTDKEARKKIRSALQKKQAITQTLLNYGRNGRPYWMEMNILPLTNRHGTVTHFAAIQRDVSQIKFQQEQLENRNRDLRALKVSLEQKVKERTLSLQHATRKLEKLAYFDSLTELPNRRFFSVQLEKQIKSCSRRKALIAFGLLDIDNFKKVNDTRGHTAGDKVLQAVAASLCNSLRGEDVVCRYGGEEFAFALSVANEQEVKAACERVIEGIRTMQVPGAGDALAITASMGVTYMKCDEHANEADLCRRADELMYEAKRAGKNRYLLEPLDQ